MINVLPTYAQTTGTTTRPRSTTTTSQLSSPASLPTINPNIPPVLRSITQLSNSKNSDVPGLMIEQLWPWKGLIALKEKDIVVPEDYKMLQWTADLEKCKTAETALSKLFEGYASTIRTAEPAPDSEVINNIEKLAEDGVDDLRQLNLQTITDKVRISSSPLPENRDSMCSLNSTVLLGTEACEDFLREITILEDTATTALGNDKGQAGALSGLLSVKARYSQQLQTLQDVVSHLQEGETPERFDGWFTTNCPAATSSCPFSQWTHDSLWSFAKVIQISKDTDKLVIKIAAPCLDTADIIEEYSLSALPYEENDHFKQVRLPEDRRVWIRKYNNNNWTTIEQPKRCTPVRGKVDICPPQTVRETKLPYLHTVIEDPYEDDQPAVEVIDLSDNQVLVASTRPETAVFKCPETTAQEHPLRGISRLKIAPGCSIDLAQGKFHLTGQLYDSILGSQFLKKGLQDKEWLPLTRDLLFGKQTNNKQPETKTSEYHQQLATYVGGAMIAIALLALLCLITLECRRINNKQNRRRRGRQANRGQTRMIIKNVPDI
jgi:hypothetical protein